MQETYVLVTAARNEEAYIERTIESVIAQTVLPQKWVIVSDNSTDRTDKIVKRYAEQYDFIELMRLESNGERNFARQVYGQQAGAERLQNIKYDFIGMLDADISVKPDYYEAILRRFGQNARLGLAGGILFDHLDGKWVRQCVSVSWSVSGPVQMFRRQCFGQIGGYLPLEKGGQDGIAEVMARMHGWEVKSFPDLEVLHYRCTGTQDSHLLSACFNAGIREYSNGYHPLFEIIKCISRFRQKPYVVGGLLRLSGYCRAFLRRDRQEIPDDVVAYRRREQLHRLHAALLGRRLQ